MSESASFIQKHLQTYVTKRNLRLFSFCAALILSLAACKGNAPEANKNGQTVPVPVSVDSARTVDMPILVDAVGVVEAYSTVTVKSQVTGVLQTVHFREGDTVKKGAPLFTIDPRPFEAAVRQAEAILARDMASLDNAKRDAERFGALAGEGFVSKEKQGQAQTAAESLEAVVRADRAALDSARLQLAYCRILSPINGVTGSLDLDEGNLVKANDVAMVTIRTIQPIHVKFSVTEGRLAEIRSAMSQERLMVKASIDETPDVEEKGYIEHIDNTVDSATGAITAVAVFENRDKRLWPGQFVKVTVELGLIRNAVAAPAQAVQTGQQGFYVIVVDKDNTAKIQPVKTGLTSDGLTVIESGLSSGETVVTDGHIRLKPGAKMEIRDDHKTGAVSK